MFTIDEFPIPVNPTAETAIHVPNVVADENEDTIPDSRWDEMYEEFVAIEAVCNGLIF